ncbi:hypothetical protein L1987_72389 [Smallanthus sonchifolius]|uniref:Uncharacterized protein n=1 Tax=Smallanthus sonchifolius TaxID=185202 RepID=A0ACB9AVG8_9ASTR|nr:hypothetical protein L1987_72389 [Smallanthus sonchifolius]
MSGVWVFKQNGVVQLVESLGSDSFQGLAQRKVLVHVPTNEVVTSYDVFIRILSSFGWERYYDDLDLLQFHKRSTVHLISLPRDFNKFKSMHMFDIVVKNRNMFEDLDKDFGFPSIQNFPSPPHSHVDMAGVWVFKQNGVVRLVESPGSDSFQVRADVRYYDDPDLLQFHKRSTVHLISLPKDFNKFKSMHMFDIVVKNRNMFEVRDM